MFFDRFCIFATSLCILPACAGINPINFLFFSLAGYSPRMRGGQPSFMATLDRPEEFSPHARGSTRRKSFAVNILTILPARGGQPISFRISRSGCRFSPHARGSTSMEILFCHLRIIYPACAGVNPITRGTGFGVENTPRMRGGNLAVARCQKVYFYFPRMRGGQPRTPSPFEGDIGFSPHARGSPFRASGSTSQSIHPACAGVNPFYRLAFRWC